MTITFLSAEEFYDAIESFVKRGLMFKADGSKLTIVFTGGY